MGNKSKVQKKGKGSVKLEHGRFKYVLFSLSLASNLLSIYQMTHTGSPKRVIFGPDLVEITDISTGNIMAKGVSNHASKAFEFSHFMPPSEPVHSQQPLAREGKKFHLLLLQFPLVFQNQLHQFMRLRFRVIQI